MKKLITLLLTITLCLICFGAPSCTQKQAESVQRKFALNTNRVASGTNDALRAIDELYNQKLITAQQAAAATQLTRKANAANEHLIDVARNYIVEVDGKRVFQLTQDGVVDLSRAIDDAVNAFNAALSDPVISGNANPQIGLLARTLGLAVKAILQIKGQLKAGASVEVAALEGALIYG